PDYMSAGAVNEIDAMDLLLRAEPSGDAYTVLLTARNSAGAQIAEVRRAVPAQWMQGGMALVCSAGQIPSTPDSSQNVITMGGVNRRGRETGGAIRLWFREWKVTGPKLDVHAARA